MKAVFIDKDGTLVEDVPYNVDPARIALTRGAALGLRRLKSRGYAILVVSNQSGVGLGLFDAGALRAVEAKLRELVPIDGFYYCPHRPDAGCGCRKPSPAMLKRAALEHRLALEDCWMVGDILHDVEAGRRAGCRTVLIDNGNETEWQMTHERVPHFVASDLTEAAAVIVQHSAIAA